jgi:hypothetical protein
LEEGEIMGEEYKIPDGLLYTEEHEWVRVEEDRTVTIGVTDYAQKQLHEIVYVELPDVEAEVEQMRADQRGSLRGGLDRQAQALGSGWGQGSPDGCRVLQEARG